MNPRESKLDSLGFIYYKCEKKVKTKPLTTRSCAGRCNCGMHMTDGFFSRDVSEICCFRKQSQTASDLRLLYSHQAQLHVSADTIRIRLRILSVSH